MSKGRIYWIKAIGDQEGLAIDITSGDSWVNTIVQQVDPGNNSVAKKTKYIKVIEYSAYLEAIEALREIAYCSFEGKEVLKRLGETKGES